MPLRFYNTFLRQLDHRQRELSPRPVDQSMFLQLIVACVILVCLCAMYKLSCMKAIDRQSLLLQFVLKSRISFILGKLKIRPTEVEITASNGVKTFLPRPDFKHTIEHVLKFNSRQHDVIIATYPKAGTTWMQEIVWLICNNADIATAKKKSVLKRTAFLERTDSNTALGYGVATAMKWPQDHQRIMKTHLRYELLPEDVRSRRKGKVIYVARNPKDVCVSYYHFHRMNEALPDPGTWDSFLSKFCSGRIGWGSWFDHNLTYWKKFNENKKQIYFVSYEDLTKNLHAELELLAKFLGKTLTRDQLDAIAEHCAFGNMSENESTNYSGLQQYGFNFKVSKFMRKGQVGDWKNYFTLNQNEAFDVLYKEKMMGSGLELEFELDSK